MTALIITVNFLALFIGIILILISYSLIRKYQLSYLNNYFYFVVCSVISGFFDWIVFNWITVWVPGLVHQTANSVYHIFWDLIGFPCALFAFYFLFLSLFDLAGKKPNLIGKRLSVLLIVLLCILSFFHTIFYAGIEHSFLGILLNSVITIVLPILYFFLCIYIYFTAAGIKNNNGIFIKKLAVILGASFFFWYILMYSQLFLHIGGWSNIIIIGYYLALLFPTLYLHTWLQKTGNTQIFKDIPVEKINLFLKEYDFTDREREIILLLYKGKSNKAIEEELFISLQTVKNYVSRIYKKLEIKNRLELVNFLRNKTN